MPDSPATGLEEELKQAFDGLHDALQRAAEATSALSALAPRVHAIAAVFDQIEAAVSEGRRQIAGASAAIGSQSAPAVFARPTLVAPPAASERSVSIPQPFAKADAGAAAATDASTEATAPAAGNGLREVIDQNAGMVAFRLEFESRPGPLDLRAVDDAISEHPAVRDIALLDYDGHKATLKVWIEGKTSAASVQVEIRDRVRSLFSAENDVTVVALEDAA